MEYSLRQLKLESQEIIAKVLILILMEYSLRPVSLLRQNTK